MKEIMTEEITLSKRMIILCNKDARLGYHSEAEGYKYYPEKLEWRVRQLETVLARDFPAVEQSILNDEDLFPDYTGIKPKGLYINSTLYKTGFEDDNQNRGNWLSFNEGKDKDKINVGI